MFITREFKKNKPTYIFGICDSQDAGAVLTKDGKIIAAVNEERLNRKKLSGAFPIRSINEVLKIGNIHPQQLDLVMLASKMTPLALMRIFRNTHQRLRESNLQFGYLLNLHIIYQSFAHKLILPKEIEAFLSTKLIRREISKLHFKARIVSVDHHLVHAYSAFTTSGFKSALIFTIDGLGDGLAVTVNIGQTDGSIKRIYAQTGFNGITLYYSRITEFLGFKPIQDEGKVTALAAYSNNYSAIDYAKRLLSFRSKGFNYFNQFIKYSKNTGIYRRLKKFTREEIAAAFQHHLEDELAKFVSYWVGKIGIHDIALAGGLFANVKLNQKINQLPEVNSIYIFPHMGDGGLAVGAIYSQLKLPSFKLDNLFWGPEYINREIREELDSNGLRYEYIEDIEDKIAYLLSQGKVVARFNGRMEYGPRALGNRSILYQPTDPTVKDWLNKRLKRTEFMPFAPATLADYANRCYLKIEGAAYTARFMNISFDCTEWMKKKCPGAVHIDGTARPQLVYPQDNPSFYLILDKYREITGLPSIINTSFNIHEEPIVCSPQEAIQAFQLSKLDYLAIGNYLVKGDSDFEKKRDEFSDNVKKTYQYEY